MKTREVYLIDGQTLNDSDTVTQDLTRGMKIVKLRVQYQATNGATSNTVGKLNSMVSKLQVVDGSEVYHSLSMQEEQARDFRLYHALPYQKLSQAAGDTVIEEAIIDFRRYEGDENFYLDTSALNSPQLQLTHDLTISATAGFASGSGKLSVIATVIDSGAPAHQGFVLAKEVDSFSSTASGDHSTDLPLDFPIAEIMVLDPVDANSPDTYLSNFKLTADTDSFIPINESYGDLLRGNREDFGTARQRMIPLNGTAATLDGDLYENVSAPVESAGTGGVATITGVAGNEATLAAASATTGTVEIGFRGSAPHAAVFYPFGDGHSADQIFSPQGVGKFQLKLTNAKTGATPKVVVIQQHG